MIDTLAMIAYLIGNENVHNKQIDLHARFVEKEKPVCVQQTKSPALRWQGVPPDAASLALIVKGQKRYYWVVYNLPPQIAGLPFAVNQEITTRDEGYNSWGQKSYHTLCEGQTTPPVTVALYALDKRFNAGYPMTGDVLEQKMQGHIIAQTTIAR